MHRAAVWQHSSTSNNKIVHNSIEHFLCNPSDFFSDDVFSSCLWIVFTNPVFQVPPQKIVRRVEILGIGWPGLSDWCETSLSHGWNESVPSYAWGIQVFCSRWCFEMRWCLISRTEHLNTSGITTRLTIFWGSTWKTGFVKIIHRQGRASSEKKSDGLHKKCSIELWTMLLFELLLCCHTAVRCMERT